MKRYNPSDIEPKWQKIWAQEGTYKVDTKNTDKPKFFGFAMLPYPSGSGLHTGHVRTYTLADVTVRAKRQQGFNAYNPIGWDAFGLPAENHAIKTGTSPRETTIKAINRFREQLQRIGMSHDWSREINTSDPEYYKWTQWIFTKLFEHGLAYQKESLQWWCEIDKTVLANEQVVGGKCWRHDSPDDPLVGKKALKQWFFKITDYVDELLDSTDDLEWPESIKTMQRNWIGRSQGAEVDFLVDGTDQKITVFTTRPDTIFGATFIVLAPELELVGEITTAKQKQEIDTYVTAALAKTDIERQETDRTKTGVFTGAYAINPANGEKVPIWTADYVLAGYGTGAVMGVPGHDERDLAFAQTFDLPVIEVIAAESREAQKAAASPVNEGVMINSGEFNNMPSTDAREKITESLIKQGKATWSTNYKIRDWLISRQRYWGAPIPIVHCQKDGAVAIQADQLPVVLPEVSDYKPQAGRSPLAKVDDWVNTTCPTCGSPAKRETDTMDGYACSSWYFLRYLDPHNDKQAWDPEIINRWMPINFYNGADHAVSHLLYARFWTHFFHKLGLVSDPEPVKKLVYNAYILARDGTKMSKSKGNVVDPLEVVESGYGADALRVYEMFLAPYDMEAPWDDKGVPGAYRFLRRIWDVTQEFLSSNELANDKSDELYKVINKTVKKVTSDIEATKFNTAIAAMMEMVNFLYKHKAEASMHTQQFKEALQTLLQLLAPFAPHITDELWAQLGGEKSIHISGWPTWDEKAMHKDVATFVVLVNGKVRAEVSLPVDANQDTVQKVALAQERVVQFVTGTPKRVVFVPGKLINFVV